MKKWLFLLLILACITAIILTYFQPKEDQDSLVLYGNVDVRQVDLGFRVDGRVAMMPHEEGDLVRKGTFMGSLDIEPYEDLVRQAEANIESFKASLTNAEILLNRREDLKGDGGISQEDYDNALSTRNVTLANLKQAEASLGVAMTNLRDTQIYAPTDGTILTRIREPGTVVRASDPIYTLSVLSPVWVRAFVSEPHLGQIYPGMKAEIYTDTENEKPFQGYIGFISPVAEFTPKTVETTSLRTDLVYRIRVYAENPNQTLRQGMPVTVKLNFREKRE